MISAEESRPTGRAHRVPREPLSLDSVPVDVGRALKIIVRLREQVRSLRAAFQNVVAANDWETRNLRGQIGTLEVQRAQARAAEDLMSMHLEESRAEVKRLRRQVADLEAVIDAAVDAEMDVDAE